MACVANAYDLAGDGIKKVVWGALAERRQELKQLLHAILDAFEIHAASDNASFAAVGVWGGGGGGGGDETADLWQVYSLLRRSW